MEEKSKYTKTIQLETSSTGMYLALVIPIAIPESDQCRSHGNRCDHAWKGWRESVIRGHLLQDRIQYIMTLIFYGVTSGATVLTAQYWGKKDTER